MGCRRGSRSIDPSPEQKDEGQAKTGHSMVVRIEYAGLTILSMIQIATGKVMLNIFIQTSSAKSTAWKSARSWVYMM